MTTLTETPHAGEHIVSEANGRLSREQITVKSGQNLKAGHVLGAIVSGTVASAAKSGGNTGNGTFVLDATTPLLPRADIGVYTLRCITAVTNGGVFRLEGPNGVVLGDFTIAAGAGGTVTVAERIKGVLTDGTTDFAVGDGFDITVSALTSKYVEYDGAGTDGSQIAVGILYDAVNASSADKRGVANVRGTEVNGNLLTWKSGATAAHKAAATASLAAADIVIRN